MKDVSLITWLAPPRLCQICGKPLTAGAPFPDLLCPGCRAETFGEQDGAEVLRCRRCGRTHFSSGRDLCPWCRESPPPQAHTLVLFSYSGMGREIIRQVKLQGLKSWIPLLIQAADRKLAAAGWEGDVLTPAAFSPRRRDIKGQGLYQFARGLAQNRGMPMNRLLRRRKGRAQKELSRDDRLTNLTGRIYAGGRTERTIPGARILLVDDVMTTGATVRESAKTLYARGAREVAVLVWAMDE